MLEAYRSCIIIVMALYVAQGDLRHYRITNRSVLLTAFGGLLWNVWLRGAGGFSHTCLGILVGSLLLIPFYVLRGMTAGDIKWLAALGAWYGPKEVVGLFLASGIALGVISMCWLLYFRFADSARSQSSIEKIEEQEAPSELDGAFASAARRQAMIPYGLPAAIGVLMMESARWMIRLS